MGVFLKVGNTIYKFNQILPNATIPTEPKPTNYTHRVDGRFELALSFNEILDILLAELPLFKSLVAVFDPMALECPRRRDSLLGIDRQHLGNQILGGLADGIPKLGTKLEPSPPGEIKDDLVVFVVKRQKSSQEQKEETPNTPDIALDIVGRKSLEHFGTEVPGRPTQGSTGISFLDLAGKGKIRQLDRVEILLVGIAQEEILGLDVPMGDPVAMQIGQGPQNTPDGRSGLLFGEGCLLFNDALQEFASLHDFHDQITKGLFLINFVELHNVGPGSGHFEVDNLVLQGVAVSPKHGRSIDLFDRIFGARGPVGSDKDHGKGTQTQPPSSLIDIVEILGNYRLDFRVGVGSDIKVFVKVSVVEISIVVAVVFQRFSLLFASISTATAIVVVVAAAAAIVIVAVIAIVVVVVVVVVDDIITAAQIVLSRP